jgi:hypothetical protein
VVDLFLAAFTQMQNIQYIYVLQHCMSMRQSGRNIIFHDMEKCLMAIDESAERTRYVTRKLQVANGLLAHMKDDSASANAAQQQKYML